MNKPSAIERELEIVIILNNDTDSNYEEDEEQESIKEKARREEQELKEAFKDADNRIIIKDRINQTRDNDIYKQILDYMKQKQFCYMKQENFCVTKRKYINYEDGDYSCCIYYSNFIIFINDGFIDRNSEMTSYKPMCIAFIKIYEDPDNKYKFSYISLICSNQKMGQCGSFLMNIIKYVSKLLKCDEIRVNSIPEEDVYEFYKRNGFNEKKEVKKVEYNYYYPINPEDAVFNPPHPIKGEISIKLSEDQEEGEVHGGKSKKRKSKNKKRKNKSKNKKCKKNKSKKSKSKKNKSKKRKNKSL
jgi:hypothetical protein